MSQLEPQGRQRDSTAPRGVPQYKIGKSPEYSKTVGMANTYLSLSMAMET